MRLESPLAGVVPEPYCSEMPIWSLLLHHQEPLRLDDCYGRIRNGCWIKSPSGRGNAITARPASRLGVRWCRRVAGEPIVAVKRELPEIRTLLDFSSMNEIHNVDLRLDFDEIRNSNNGVVVKARTDVPVRVVINYTGPGVERVQPYEIDRFNSGLTRSISGSWEPKHSTLANPCRDASLFPFSFVYQRHFYAPPSMGSRPSFTPDTIEFAILE